MRITAAGTARSRLSEPGRVAESMLAKISLVIWASNNGWAESRLVTKVGLSEELAMASIFNACEGDAEAVSVGRATRPRKGEPNHHPRASNLRESELFAKRSSKRWKWEK